MQSVCWWKTIAWVKGQIYVVDGLFFLTYMLIICEFFVGYLDKRSLGVSNFYNLVGKSSFKFVLNDKNNLTILN